MIQKKMSGDITKMESKVFFGFTPRQVTYSVIAFVSALLINKIFGFIDFKTRGFIMMTVALPLLGCGFVKFNGLPFEKHLKILIEYNLSPKERVWESEWENEE